MCRENYLDLTNEYQACFSRKNWHKQGRCNRCGEVSYRLVSFMPGALFSKVCPSCYSKCVVEGGKGNG